MVTRAAADSSRRSDEHNALPKYKHHTRSSVGELHGWHLPGDRLHERPETRRAAPTLYWCAYATVTMRDRYTDLQVEALKMSIDNAKTH